MLHSRMARVTEVIKGALAEIIDQKLANPKIPRFVTIHSVKVARDLRSAQVFVTFLQDDDPKGVEAAVAELNKSAGFIRAELGRAVVLRYIPHLNFHYNPSTHYAADLEKIFHEMHGEERQK
ncbi:30S ribosome-binding factor RbfA, partial [Candidatus Sumerlaeota bacterium]|nr:30S ribosome-binding factor RbfA [Candidatus Sumerlaeota bacterium]